MLPAVLGTEDVAGRPDAGMVLNLALAFRALVDLGSFLAAVGISGPWLSPELGEGSESHVAPTPRSHTDTAAVESAV